MKRKRNLLLAVTLIVSLAALGIAQAVLEAATAQSDTVQAPRFEVDPLWPRPLPNHWLLGNAIGVGVDARDHVFIVHRQDTINDSTEAGAGAGGPVSECCTAAPPVIEFDPEGNVVSAWGGPAAGYDWPLSNHGISIDDKGNVWIGGNGNTDSHILKFTHDGKFLTQIGIPKRVPVTNPPPGHTQGSSRAMDHFGRVAKVSFDLKAQEAYVADGYLNKRVAVVDMATGAIKRFWGAYGETPSDSNYGPYNPDVPLIRQFRTPVHCAEPSNDGLVYVCDRPNDRIQVFRANGEFVKEVRIAPRTLGDGSVWDIAFSRDTPQKYLYLADGKNEKIYVIDRQSMEILTSFGDGGRQPGQWFAVHSIATDSKGNIYTTETYEGKRVQKFVYKGLARVTRAHQGTPWPKK
jgi:DNA-binding beta-propeller fold protein YncE